MPIRFQVDPDFYDHPKSIDLSDAAVALWTRAGSYSAAKLLDGLVPTNALPSLSKTPNEAAAELVRSGLWRKVRRGHQFHQWDHRNLTRERVEHERTVDRERKRTGREIKAEKERAAKEAQVSGTIVRPESDRTAEGNPGGNPAGVPAMSVSVSVSSKAVSSKSESDVSNANENNVHSITEEPRSKAYPVGVWKIAKAYAAKVNPSNPATVAGHILNATQTWELDTIAQAIARLAANNRAVGADSLRIELNEIGCDKTGIQRFPDGTYVDHNTGILKTANGQIIGGGGYLSGNRMWRE